MNYSLAVLWMKKNLKVATKTAENDAEDIQVDQGARSESIVPHLPLSHVKYVKWMCLVKTRNHMSAWVQAQEAQ